MIFLAKNKASKETIYLLFSCEIFAGLIFLRKKMIAFFLVKYERQRKGKIHRKKNTVGKNLFLML